MTRLHSSDTGTLIQGDCMEELERIPDGAADMVLCDPPYGTTSCDWDKRLPTREFWRQLLRIVRENGAIVLTAQQPFATELIVAAGHRFRYELIWEKDVAVGFLNANRMPLRAHENVLVFYRRLPTYNPQWEEGKPYRKSTRARNCEVYQKEMTGQGIDNPGRRYPRSVLRFPRGLETRHPTEKPLGLFRWLVLTYTNPGETVVDPCLGSGTTAVACEETGRRWIGIERSEEYCRMALERLARRGGEETVRR